MQIWCLEVALCSILALIVLSVRLNEGKRCSETASIDCSTTIRVVHPDSSGLRNDVAPLIPSGVQGVMVTSILIHSTLNPARSFGPVLANGFSDGADYLWVEVTAPVLGSIVGAIAFYFVNFDGFSVVSSHQAVDAGGMRDNYYFSKQQRLMRSSPA
eukprot:jgi/Bigna1/72716/fgenesh1_pg.21_\